jgi:hypothetical protein
MWVLRQYFHLDQIDELTRRLPIEHRAQAIETGIRDDS